MTHLTITEDPGEEFAFCGINTITGLRDDGVIFYADVSKVHVLPERESFTIQVIEILSKVVYAERAHPVEMISKVSLGGLLDLFLTVDEFDARYDFGEQFRTVEPAPVFLGFQAQFKDHGQCRDS